MSDSEAAHSGSFLLQAPALYVVATPIGHLADMTLRAIEVLKAVDIVAAEDTRTSRTLLDHYGIRTRMVAVHEHNERASAQGLIQWLGQGKRVALITDAGTPAISDPGAQVVAAVRAAGYRVVPVPGASALTAALSVAGVAGGPVTFVGFLPVKGGQRREALSGFADTPSTVVCYESPHRILETLEDINTVMGAERGVVLCRELTKRFETILEGGAADLLARLREDADQQRGEFVLVIRPAGTRASDGPGREAERVLGLLLDALPTRQAASLAASITGARKNDLYARALAFKAGHADPSGPREAGDTQD